ncbi:MAG: OmpA family protein [Bacteroidia bacterium]|nr:OmpA family protein [Bacteroidia bacterium]
MWRKGIESLIAARRSAGRCGRRHAGRLSGLCLAAYVRLCAQAPDHPAARLENLGPNVNSKYEEGYPFPAPDGKTLFFARNKHPDNVGGVYGVESNYDVWVSRLQADGTWSPAENFGKPVNNLYDNGVVGVSQDGNTLLLLNTYEQGSGSSPLAFVRRTATGWTAPKPMPMAGHKAEGYYDLMLAADGQTLLMMMQNPASKSGDYDLYVSFLLPDSTWTRPQTLGPPVCSPAPEARPFLALDGRTLYFARKVSKPKPNVDIFVSKRLDDSWRRWTPPKRLPAPINSKHDDVDFVVPPNAEYAFVTSKQHSLGHLDIFKTALAAEFRPEPVVVVKGFIYDDETNAAVQAEVVTAAIPKGKYLVKGRTDPRTGEYTLVLPVGAKYVVVATPQTDANYIADSTIIDLTDARNFREERRDIRLSPNPTLLTIRTFDAKTRKPVRVAVQYFFDESKTGTTVADGELRIAAPRKTSRIRIVAEAEGYRTLDTVCIVRPDLRGKAIEENFALQRSGYVIKGRLFDGATGRQIEGHIRLTDPEGEVYFSDAPYRFEFAKAGECVVEAHAKGYDRKIVPVVVHDDSIVTSRDIYLKSGSRVVIRGRTVEQTTGKPLVADVAYSMSGEKTVFGGLFTDESGRFKAEFDSRGEYVFVAKKDGYLPAYEKISIIENGAAPEVELRLQPIVEGATALLDYVYFAFADSTLLPESHAQLAPLAEMLLNAPTMRVEISGHTDYVGKNVDNMRLSLARAQAVKRYFVEAGVAENRLVALGFGETRPLASNKTVEGRKLNRRVEFKVLAK